MRPIIQSISYPIVTTPVKAANLSKTGETARTGRIHAKPSEFAQDQQQLIKHRVSNEAKYRLFCNKN
jgi:hypothetical protein